MKVPRTGTVLAEGTLVTCVTKEGRKSQPSATAVDKAAAVLSALNGDNREIDMQKCPACSNTEKDEISICHVCGTIIDKDKENESSDKSARVESPISLHWFVVILLCILFGYITYSKLVDNKVFDHQQSNNMSQLSLQMLTYDNVNKVEIRPQSAYNKEDTLCLTKPYRNHFIDLTTKMVPAQFMGAHMNYYRDIVIDAGDVGKFSLYIVARGQDVHADFTRYAERDPKVDYDAKELFEWLENLPKDALQRCSAGTTN